MGVITPPLTRPGYGYFLAKSWRGDRPTRPTPEVSRIDLEMRGVLWGCFAKGDSVVRFLDWRMVGGWQLPRVEKMVFESSHFHSKKNICFFF